jgi:hypothetical protein
MSQLLPQLPNLEHLKGQAKDVLRVVRRRKPAWKLAHAQHAVARGYGFTNWPDLKTHVESLRLHSPASSTPRRSSSERECRDGSEHPIVGTWAHDGVMLDFSMAGNTITMTQVAVDPSGCDIAIKVTLRGDGSGDPVRFGKGLVLEARLAESQCLEAVFKNGAHIVSQSTYTVSADRQTLTFSTSATQIVFERM